MCGLGSNASPRHAAIDSDPGCRPFCIGVTMCGLGRQKALGMHQCRLFCIGVPREGWVEPRALGMLTFLKHHLNRRS